MPVLIIALLGIAVIAALAVRGFRDAVREGKIVIVDSGRFDSPVVNPNGSPPVDNGYWRRRYMAEHPERFANWKE